MLTHSDILQNKKSITHCLCLCFDNLMAEGVKSNSGLIIEY